METLQKYIQHLPSRYSTYPRGYYLTLVLLRTVEGEAIFRTEGSGEPLNREFVHAGAKEDTPVIPRVVISKRKQTAVERRTGRELLRRIDLLAADAGLNEGRPEPDSIDSMLYGYAVGKGESEAKGSQKSRVITDDAFSILPATQVVGKRQFNGIFENGTMRLGTTASSSLGTDEYVRPETHFIDMETLKDVTPGEFIYVLGNILRSSRYGAISSRVGKIHNEVVACIFSDCELFSNLELTQHTWDRLCVDGNAPEPPLADEAVFQAVTDAITELQGGVYGRVVRMTDVDLQSLLQEVQQIYADEAKAKALLAEVQAMYKK